MSISEIGIEMRIFLGVRGICGYLNLNNTTGSVNRSMLEKLKKVITSRGPDDKGSYVDDRLGLARRRLSIIDLEVSK